MPENYTKANANELTILDDPDSSQAFILVDKVQNQGYLLDYNKLLNALLDKLVSEDMSESSTKVYFVG